VSDNNGGGTWPEQDAIDIWIKKHNIAIVHQHTLKLKKEVTKPRIEVQNKLTQANTRIDELTTEKAACMEHWNESDVEIGEQQEKIDRLCEALTNAATDIEDATYSAGCSDDAIKGYRDLVKETKDNE
jgi:chromosome segregation ATPase